MDKKELIINTLDEIINEGLGNSCSVSEIAKRAGIAKGGIYYYFKSKDEILDTLITEKYATIIAKCNSVTQLSHLSPTQKLEQVFITYYSEQMNHEFDILLHEPQYAHLHQKSLAHIVKSMTPIISSIFEEGNQSKDFNVTYPVEFSEFILTNFAFLFDPGIFTWNKEEVILKLQSLSVIIERMLELPDGSMYFLVSTFENRNKR
ncbi:TetR/AcrR family transcriptional regulator [Macrococcus animalis]|uniref:TetR/AcrR family transcriptional regulator n=1 Tax=Macrococcus animalis TaxID=3395467 RepID=UPI0039BDD138